MIQYSAQGNTNLLIIDKARNFTDWMYDEVSPFLKGNILEIGSGFGTYSGRLVKDFPDSKIVLSDCDENYASSLKKFENDNVSSRRIDISKREHFESLKNSMDSVLALNVMEHIEDDVSAMKNIYEALSPGGKFVFLVPAHKFLFNCIDEGVGHFRRYSKTELTRKAEEAGFVVKKLFYFNCFSIPGWFVNGNMMKKNILSENAVSLFDRLVPAFRFVERYVIRGKIGISLIVVLEKPSII
jgi:SAM-dependent methyltransferase